MSGQVTVVGQDSFTDELQQKIRSIAGRSLNPHDAEQKLKAAFPPPQLVWTKGHGPFEVTVFYRSFSGADLNEIICTLG